MAHLRSAIFDAVKARLAAIPDFSADGKVERGRIGPIRAEALPAITLTWADDDERAEVRPFATAGGADGYDRDLPISVIVHLRSTDPETAFDDIAVEIEKALAADVTLGGAAVEMLLQSTRLFVDQQTGLPLGAGRLVYRTHYKSVAADPETAAL